MNFMLEFDQMDAALDAAARDFVLANKLYEELLLIQSFAILDNPSKLEKGFAKDSMDNVNKLLGQEVFSLEALSLENAKNMGRKVIRAIAEFIKRAYAIVKNFFTGEDKKSEEQTQRITDALKDFKEKVRVSDEAIKNFDLTPGMVPTKEQKEALKEANVEVLLTGEGKVADKQMIDRDLTILLSKNVAKNSRLAYLSDEKGRLGDLVGNLELAIQALESNASVGYNVALDELGGRLMQIQNFDDVSYIRNEGVINCRSFVINAIRDAKLRKEGPTGVLYQARPFMNRWYPTFTKKRLGRAEYLSFAISASSGRMDKSPRAPKKYTHSKISIEDLERLMDSRTRLLAFIDLMNGKANEAGQKLAELASKDGEAISQAQEKAVAAIDSKDQSILREIDGMIRGFPKAMIEANSIFINSGRAASELAVNLGYYIEGMIKVELEIPTVD